MARENPLWGHRRIQGGLAKLGFQIAHSTVWEILHKAGIATNPDRPWTAQQARNLAMTMGTSLDQMRFLLRDRGSQFTTAFDSVFEGCGLRTAD